MIILSIGPLYHYWYNCLNEIPGWLYEIKDRRQRFKILRAQTYLKSFGQYTKYNHNNHNSDGEDDKSDDVDDEKIIITITIKFNYVIII